jgi:hypothetical protein
MANSPSPYSTYSDTTPHVRVITDAISLLDPSDAPFVEVIGGLDGAASKFQFRNQGKLVEWLEDTLTPISGVFAAAATLASDVLTITVDDGDVFQPGHIILVGSEKMWVSAVTGDIITVTRGLGATNAASCDSIAAYTIIGMARLEGDDSDPIGFTDVTVNSNYTQIFHKEIKVTGTEMYQDTYGMSDPYQYQAAKSIPEMMRLIERTLQYGERDAGTTTTPRMMGGYQTFITNNLADGSSISVTKIEDAIELAYNDGSSGDFVAIVNPATSQKIKALYDASNYVRYSPDQTVFGVEVEKVRTPFGSLTMVMDRWQLSSLIPILKLENIGMLTLRPWQLEDLAKTGDAKKTELIGEFTLCVKQDKSHALLTAVS